MDQDTPVILVFDSGLGGTTILNHILARKISGPFIYVADNKFLPYGQQTKEFIQERVLEIFSKLNQKYAIKSAVLACNTVTAYVAEQLRGSYNFPIIGMEPGIKPAIKVSKNKNIGILATEGTIKSLRFTSLVDRFVSEEHNLIIIPGNGLVEEIENLPDSAEELLNNLKPKIKQFEDAGIDVLVLGCTHYPLIIKQLKSLFSNNIEIIDTTQAVVNVLENTLKAECFPNNQEVEVMVSDNSNSYYEKIRKVIQAASIKQIKFI
jgi:glutamate racemase